MNRIVVLVVLLMAFSSCSKFSKIQKRTDYDYKLKMAEEYFAKKSYNNAQMLFDDIFPAMKGTARFEDLYYKYAYCAFYLKDYLNAENLYKGFVELFPNSNKAEECDYMRAYCYYKQSPKVDLDQTNTGRTVALMQAFINTHPNSTRLKEATDIIDACRIKMEYKDYKSADLYYALSNYKSAATAFTTLAENYPDSQKSDEYKMMVVKAWYMYALNSVVEKQKERFERVLNECNDFEDRYPDSKLVDEVLKYRKLTNNNLKNIKL
jgi:outer membrane protein assembly factor BamD